MYIGYKLGILVLLMSVFTFGGEIYYLRSIVALSLMLGALIYIFVSIFGYEEEKINDIVISSSNNNQNVQTSNIERSVHREFHVSVAKSKKT